MKIGIIGTGMVGRSLGERLVELGYDVMIGTRDLKKTMSRTEPDMYGNPPFNEWHKTNQNIKLGTFSDAAVYGEFLINATTGASSLEALKLVGEDYLNEKVLIDIANPLDFSKGMPPTLFKSNTDSLGEQIQRTFPKVKVVKSLNTVNALVMVNPGQLKGADHTIFLSGNDADAKSRVTELLRSFGWKDIIDLGDITTARGTEMILAIWVRLYGVLGKPMFNFKIVR